MTFCEVETEIEIQSHQEIKDTKHWGQLIEDFDRKALASVSKSTIDPSVSYLSSVGVIDYFSYTNVHFIS